jgi:hypothetical protein
LVLKQFPGLDAVEELKEKYAEEDLLFLLGTLIDNAPNEILAHPVCCSVDVGETERAKNRIFGPGRGGSGESPEENLLALRCKAPVGIKYGSGT